MCVSRVVLEDSCVGACKEGAEPELQRSLCHSEEERYMGMSLEELKEEVKRLRMMAVKSATALHDLAEEGLPNRWQEIPEVAQQAYEVHRSYFKAKKVFEERTKQQEVKT